MISQMFKKELNEKKTLIFLGFLLCVFPPVLQAILVTFGVIKGKIIADFSFTLSWVFYFIFAFLFPVLLASSSVSGEVEKGNINFLLSLPVSRWHIWSYKVFSSVTIVYSLLIVYLLANPVLVRAFQTDNSNYYIVVWFSVLYALMPLLAIAITFCISSLFVNELQTALVSVIVQVAFYSGFWTLITVLAWDVFPLDIGIIALLAIISFLAISVIVFARGESLQNFRWKLKPALISIILCLVAGSLILTPMYMRSYTYKPEDIYRAIPTGTIGANGDSILFWVQFKDVRTKRFNGALFIPSVDQRIWLFSEKNRRFKEVPLRYVGAPFRNYVSPDKRYILIEQAYNFIQLAVLQNYKTAQLMLYDTETGKTRRIDDFYYYRFQHEDWLDNERFFMALPDTYPGKNFKSLRIYNVNNGNVNEISLPQEDFRHHSVDFQSIGSNIFVIYGKNEYDIMIKKPDYSFGKCIVVKKLDVARKSLETILDLKTDIAEEFIYVTSGSISPDGKHILYMRQLDETVRVLVRNLEDGSEREIDLSCYLNTGKNEIYQCWARWMKIESLVSIIAWKAEKKDILNDYGARVKYLFFADISDMKVKKQLTSTEISPIEVNPSGKGAFLSLERIENSRVYDLYLNIVDLKNNLATKRIYLTKEPLRMRKINCLHWFSPDSLFYIENDNLCSITTEGSRTVMCELRKMMPEAELYRFVYWK